MRQLTKALLGDFPDLRDRLRLIEAIGSQFNWIRLWSYLCPQNIVERVGKLSSNEQSSC